VGSKPGQHKANWRKPEGWFLKCIINRYYERGLRDTKLADALYRHVPRPLVIQITGRADVNANTIEQRGHKGVFKDNAFEHPDKHHIGKLLLDAAERVIKENRINLTLDDILEITNEAYRRLRIKVKEPS
jgi:hypothetical protein